MFGFGQLIGILKKSPKKIVFTEGEDSRILEASSRLLASNFLHPILIGNEEKIMNAAEESGFNIRGAEIIDPEKYEKMDCNSVQNRESNDANLTFVKYHAIIRDKTKGSTSDKEM